MKITVLIPVFNTKPHHLMEAFMSIHTQTLRPDEVIIVDDGSTDKATIKTLEMLSGIYGAKVHMLMFNQGTSVALNTGHHLARNEWIALMGSDDVSFYNRLEIQSNYINAHPETDVLGTGLFTFQDKDPFRKIGFRKYHPEVITQPKENGWVLNHGTVMYKKSVVTSEQINGYNPEWRRGQDVELWKRIFAAGFRIRNIQDILYGYRRFK